MHKFIDGSLNRNEIIRYNLSVPEIGITVQVCAEGGQIAVYGSVTYQNPNSALNDFQLVVDCTTSTNKNCSCGKVFVPSKLQKLHYDRTVKREATATVVYITVEGTDDSRENVFVMNATDGDVPTDCVGNEVADDCGGKDITTNPPESEMCISICLATMQYHSLFVLHCVLSYVVLSEDCYVFCYVVLA